VPLAAIYLLGRFEVRAGDRVVLDRSWRRRKAAAVLKLLAIQRAGSLHREQIMDALWPDLDPAAAANNLHKSLHYLRTAFAEQGLSGQVIRFTGDIVALSPDVWIDCYEFCRLAEAARGAGEPAAFEAALALYSGDLLPDDPYEDWAAPLRDELRQLRAQLLSEVSRIYETQGQMERAAERLRQLLADDPVNEGAHRSLIRLYAQSGSRHRALRQYQQCREALQRELGVEPSPETDAAYQAIVRGGARAATSGPVSALEIEAGSQAIVRGRAPDQSSRSAAVPGGPPVRAAGRGAGHGSASPQGEAGGAPPVPVPVARPSQPAHPLFGREAEREQAEALLDAALGGQGQALFITGVAGIGKSHLAQHLVEAVQRRGALTLAGRCYELEAAASYRPVRDVLAQLMAEARASGDDPAAALLQQSVHLKRLLAAPAVEVPAVADPALLQVALFQEAVSLFAAVASEARPLVLFFDDLHAADEATLRLVHFLCRHLEREAILLLATYRAEDAAQSPPLISLLASLRRERLGRELALGPLPDGAIRRLVEHRFGGRAVAADLVQEIAGRAEGNPLFATELVHTAIEQGWARVVDGQWQRRDGSVAPVPGAVHDLLDRRLQRLSDAGRQVLHLAATMGCDVDYALLRRALPLPEAELLDGMDECLGAYVLQETPEGYRFHHSLLREAVYRRLTRARRQQLHRTLAAAMAAGPADAPAGEGGQAAEAIGYHFAQSDEPWRATPFLRRAARRAAAVYANDQAVRLYEQAIAILRAHPARAEPLHLALLLEELGDLRQRAGEAARSAALFEETCTLLAGAGQDEHVVRVQGKTALAQIAAGNVHRAGELLQTMLQALTEQSPQMVVARTYYILAQLHWHSAEYREALQAAEKAFQAAQSSGDAAEQAHAYEVLALACHSLGEWQKGVECELNRHRLGVPGFDTEEAFDAHL
jgi:DNA-binding SARP family transcriptional activator